MARTIFVSGIHGVGKSYLCEAVCQRLGLPHYGASELIRAYNNSLVTSDKSVKDVASNQDVLLSQFHKLDESGLILLDGHTCLLKDGREIERVPMSTFEGLQLCSLILVEASITEIVERLQARDGIRHDSLKLEEMLMAEKQYSLEISKALGIPFVQVHSNDEGVDKVIDFVAARI